MWRIVRRWNVELWSYSIEYITNDPWGEGLMQTVIVNMHSSPEALKAHLKQQMKAFDLPVIEVIPSKMREVKS